MRAMCRVLLCLVILLAEGVAAQTPGKASFVVYEKGQPVGTMETHVSRTNDGWRIQASMEAKGAVPIRIANLDLLYDRNWFGRWMTMEMKAPDDVLVHVAVARITAQIDVVRAGRSALPIDQRIAEHDPASRTCLRRLRSGRGAPCWRPRTR